MLKTTFYVMLLVMPDKVKLCNKISGFSMKNCLSLPRLGLKYFNSFKTEEDEPNYTHNDKYVRWFVRQAAYGGGVCALNQ